MEETGFHNSQNTTIVQEVQEPTEFKGVRNGNAGRSKDFMVQEYQNKIQISEHVKQIKLRGYS